MIIRAIETEADRPRDDLISAVFLIALRGDGILSVRNERGWDIPGGHVEPPETPLSALVREVLEEASASFRQAEPCSFATVPNRRDIMLFFATDDFELGPFSSSADAIDRDVVPIQVLLDRYYGPKNILRQIISSAEAVIRSRHHARASRDGR